MPKATKDNGKPPPKKKSKPGKQSSLLAYKNDPVQLNQVLQSKYEGKRILLTAASLYGRKIPKGEEELLFQYHIGSVNSDNTTATIEYDDRCITEGDHVFQAYPDNTETTIDDYNLSTFQEDHKRYHIHLGREQKIINDAKEASQKEEKEATAKNLLNMADIDGKMAEEISCYDILVAEFESVGELVDYVVQEGDHAGKVIKKQKWSKCVCYFNLQIITLLTHPFFCFRDLSVTYKSTQTFISTHKYPRDLPNLSTTSS